MVSEEAFHTLLDKSSAARQNKPRLVDRTSGEKSPSLLQCCTRAVLASVFLPTACGFMNSSETVLVYKSRRTGVVGK